MSDPVERARALLGESAPLMSGWSSEEQWHRATTLLAELTDEVERLQGEARADMAAEYSKEILLREKERNAALDEASNLRGLVGELADAVEYMHDKLSAAHGGFPGDVELIARARAIL